MITYPTISARNTRNKLKSIKTDVELKRQMRLRDIETHKLNSSRWIFNKEWDKEWDEDREASKTFVAALPWWKKFGKVYALEKREFKRLRALRKTSGQESKTR